MIHARRWQKLCEDCCCGVSVRVCVFVYFDMYVCVCVSLYARVCVLARVRACLQAIVKVVPSCKCVSE